MHYWYEGQKHNNRRVYRGDGTSQGHTRYLYWSGTEWVISRTIGSGDFAWCSEYTLFECDGRIIIKYCFHGHELDDEYIINGTYNGRWIFQAINIDKFIYYYLEDATWKVTDQYRNNIYATCNQQNIFQCQTGITFSTCKTRASTQSPTVGPSLTPSGSNIPSATPSTLPEDYNEVMVETAPISSSTVITNKTKQQDFNLASSELFWIIIRHIFDQSA